MAAVICFIRYWDSIAAIDPDDLYAGDLTLARFAGDIRTRYMDGQHIPDRAGGLYYDR